MPRMPWNDLPAPVRAAIERECGQILRVESLSAGRNSDFSAILHTTDGSVFCKGVAGVSGKREELHRHEVLINSWLPRAVTPRLLWILDVEDWSLLGFEHVPGHHADLSPGSPDLPLVLDAVNLLARELAVCPVLLPQLANKITWMAGWRRLRHDPPKNLDGWSRCHLNEFVAWEQCAADAVRGTSLLHTDLHPLNILVADRARIVDWAWSRRGAGWTDAAHLVVRLIDRGHPPGQAERWAAETAAWSEAGDEDLTSFAVALLGMWTYLEFRDPQPHRRRLTEAARTWARHRLTAGAGR